MHEINELTTMLTNKQENRMPATNSTYPKMAVQWFKFEEYYMTDFGKILPYVRQALFLLIRRYHFFELISFKISIDNC